MVKIINDSIFKGIAGRRPTTKPKYFIMHNDAGSMTPESYQVWLKKRYNNGQSDLGFAHYYINRNTILRVEDTYNGTWSCANYNANMNSIGYEVCEQLKVNDEEFIENENMVLRQMAEDMTFYGMTPNASNIKFHQEFYNTSCPGRSVKLHGGLEGLRNHVINSIAKYQTLGKTVEEMIENEKTKAGWQSNSTGWWYVKKDGNYVTDDWIHVGDNWYWATENGYILENSWKEVNDNWYWFKSGGYMAKNETLTINGKECYFNDWGALVTEIKHYRK